ncbi:unnamed protein product [Linum tenue]|uniref:Uncharacterized protein n=1 Tax=Linum tenue TaxID=586396 RepID=A0AAV0HKC0_9ROSI|nr:unnamed protein product [Linum tenue]
MKGESSATRRSSIEGNTNPMGSSGVVLQWMTDRSTRTRPLNPLSQAETRSFPSQEGNQSLSSASLSFSAQGEGRPSKLPIVHRACRDEPNGGKE